MAGRAGRNLVSKGEGQKWFRPGHKKGRNRDTNKRKELQALTINFTKARGGKMGGARKKRIEREGKSLGDHAQRPTEAIGTAEQTDGRHVLGHYAQDKDVNV